MRASNSFSYAHMSHAQKPLSHLLKPQPPDISGNGDSSGMPMLSAHHRLVGVCVSMQKAHGCSIEKPSTVCAGSGSKGWSWLISSLLARHRLMLLTTPRKVSFALERGLVHRRRQPTLQACPFLTCGPLLSSAQPSSFLSWPMVVSPGMPC